MTRAPSAMGLTGAIALLCAGGLAAPPAAAEPLYDGDVGVLTGIYRLPDSTGGARLAPGGGIAWSLTSIVSSHATIERGPGELLRLDGETHRVELEVAYRAAKRLELGIQLPHLRHSSGNLDSFIDDWHSLIGLTGGDRVRQPQDALGFRYDAAQETLLDVRRASNGIGDLRLYAAWLIDEHPERSTAIRAGVTLPTGDADNLHGSGGASFSLGLVGDYDLGSLGAGGRLTTFYRVHLNRLARPEFLAAQHRAVVGQVATGLGVQLSRRAEVRVQATARSPIYDSSIEILGDPSFTLTVGANIALTPAYVLSFGITEDIKVNSAPDVAFQLGVRYRPRVD